MLYYCPLEGYKERFLRLVHTSDPDLCWLWGGGFFKHTGYGYFDVDGTRMYAHRFAKFLELNRVLDSSIHVLHQCDVRLCCNPLHLFLGNNLINSLDRDLKGRTAKGENSGAARLTSADVLSIRRLYEEGNHSYHSLARKFGVFYTNIQAIVKRRSWKHI